MRTKSPNEDAPAMKRTPSSVEEAEKTRIEVDRAGERDDADVRLEGDLTPRSDEGFAAVESARRTRDTDRRV